MRCIFCDSKDLSLNENIYYCNSCHKTMIKDKTHKYSLSLNDKKSVKSYREELDKAIKMNLQKEIIASSKKILEIIPNDTIAYIWLWALKKDRYNDKYTNFLKKIPIIATREEVDEVIDIIIDNAYFCEVKPITNIIKKMKLNQNYINKLNDRIYNLGMKTRMDYLYPRCYSLLKSEDDEIEDLRGYIYLAEYLSYNGNDIHDGNINKNLELTNIINDCDKPIDLNEDINRNCNKKMDEYLKGINFNANNSLFEIIDYENNLVSFGSFPKTIKEDYVEIEEINGEYIGSDNAKYVRKRCVLPSSKYTSYFSDGSVYTNGKRYFRIEPIKWQMIDFKDNMVCLLANDIIDVNIYSLFEDNFENSNIYNYLNNTFLNTAFSEKQKEIIKGDVRLLNGEEIDLIKKKYPLGIMKLMLDKKLTDYAASNKIDCLSKNYWIDCERFNLLTLGIVKTIEYTHAPRGVVPMIWIKIR